MQTKVTDNPAELGEMLDDQAVEIMSLDELTPEVILISYQTRKEWVRENSSSNVVVSLFTTSLARIQLWKAMRAVVSTPGCRLLYTDVSIALPPFLGRGGLLAQTPPPHQ